MLKNLSKIEQIYLQDSFDFDTEVDNYRFWLMMSLRRPSCQVIQIRLANTDSELVNKLALLFSDRKQAKQTFEKIKKTAFYTIPESFFKHLERIKDYIK